MNFKSTLSLMVALFVCLGAWAQEEEESEKLQFSGSVDAYYKYDFSGQPNITTSFANDQNSMSIGWVDLIMEKTVKKAYFKAELSMGPRSFGSVPSISFGAGESAVQYFPNIQNLYMSYNFTDKFKVSGGYMATHVGYELIAPTGNFHYSTTYLFTNGPFQHAGIKFDYAINDKLSVMAGIFNPWNVYQAPAEVGPTSFGGQIAVAPNDKVSLYLNGVVGGGSGNIIDLTGSYDPSDKVHIGLNAAYYDYAPDSGAVSQFYGAAGFFQYAVSDPVAIGVRFEHFFSNGEKGILGEADASVNTITVSANLKAGPLTFIPEFRSDLGSEAIFIGGNGGAVKTATQALIAAVFAF